MRKTTLRSVVLGLGLLSFILLLVSRTTETTSQIEPITFEKKEKKSIDEKYQFAQERVQFEYDLQKDPVSGTIPKDQKADELGIALDQSRNPANTRTSSNVYISRGPSNLGGRTRAFVMDISDATGNTMLAGGVSGGVFRTTNGGTSWTKVSPNDEVHNVTAIAQDPRPGFQNIWYYGTGELFGNSAALGSFFPGQGVWRSEDSGLTWTQIPGTNSTFEAILDSPFDIINALAVSPLNGDLFIAAFRSIHRYDGTDISLEISGAGNSAGWTDIVITSTGRVYATVDGANNNTTNGVYTSATGDGGFTRIAQEGTPTGWNTGGSGRIVLAYCAFK